MPKPRAARNCPTEPEPGVPANHGSSRAGPVDVAVMRSSQVTFVFTSPQDDHVDRASYLERGFPTKDRLQRHELLHVTPTNADDVLALYEYELKTGEVLRDAPKSSLCRTARSSRHRASSVVASTAGAVGPLCADHP